MTFPTYCLLIVEQSPTVRDQYQRDLQANSTCNYQCLAATSIESGVELCGASAIDVVLLGESLANLKGLTFLEALSHRDPVNRPGVVMIAATVDASVAVSAIKLGAEDYLVQPVTPERLQAAVRSAIETARSQWPSERDRFQICIDNMLDCVAICSAIRDATGKIVDFRFDYLNPGALATDQMGGAEVGLKMCEVLPASRETGLFDEYCQVVESGKPLTKENLIYSDMLGPQRLTHAYDLRVSKLGDGIVGAWRDVTDRKQAELDLKLAHQQAQEAQNQSNIGIQVAGVGLARFDYDSDRVTLSPQAAAMFGFAADTVEVSIADMYATFHPDERAELVETIEQVLNPESTGWFARDHRVVWPNQEVRWLRVHKQVLFDRSSPISRPTYGVLAASDVTEAKRTEEASRQSEFQIRRILNGLLSFVGIMTPDGTLIEANRPALEAARLTPEDVLGKPVPDTYWWSYDAAIQAQLWTAIHQAAAGATVRYDVVVRLAADHFITIDFTLAPLFDESGQVELLIPSGIDITERKRAEAALKDSMAQIKDYVERMTLALDTAKMASWYWDLITGEITWSSYHETLWDYQLGIHNRRYEDWSRRVHPDDLPRVEAAIEMAKQAKTDFLEEYRVIWADGTLRWVVGFGRFYFNNEGEPYRMMGTVQDITDRKEIEATLDLSEQQLRMATEAVDLGLWFWHLSDDRLVWTACCKRLFGLDADTEMTYERFLAALHPQDRDRTHAAVQLAITDKTAYRIEYRTVWSDQSIHWILAQAQVSYDNQDRPIRMVGTAQDITLQKQAEAMLQGYADELNQINTQLVETTEVVTQRNQELDQYAYIVSHDLKAPLRAISNLSHWIEEDLQGTMSADVQAQMALLRSRVCRMETMINGLLDYARIGRSDSVVDTVAVEELLLEVIDTVSLPATFTVTLAPNLPTFDTKRLLLLQVFTNLIGNAAKHHDRVDGSVHISVADRGNFYEFAVADDGPGIGREYQDKIFTIFHTASSKKQQDSTGVGLAIVKKIVETEGGAVWLESQVWQGTTFYFTWPK